MIYRLVYADIAENEAHKDFEAETPEQAKELIKNYLTIPSIIKPFPDFSEFVVVEPPSMVPLFTEEDFA